MERRATVALILGLAALYVAAARLSLSLDPVSRFATTVRAPTGISLAALLLLGRRVWPGVLIGAFFANLLTGAPIAVALGIALGNTAEALLGAWLCRCLPRFTVTLEDVRSVMRFIVAAVVAPAVSASIGVASLAAGHLVADPRIRGVWSAWWIGDLVGALLVAPVILVWSRKPRAPLRHRWFELAGLAAAGALVSLATFFSYVTGVRGLWTPFHQTNLLLAVLIWSALRYGQRGAATATFCISVIAVTATTLGYGPFARPRLTAGLLALQTYMATVAVLLLLLGATIAERRCAHAAARRAHRSAARANYAKSEFLAVVSHELRTPLTAIAGYSQLLESGVYGPLNEQQADGIARIHRNEQQLLSIIEEVLGFVSAEKGRIAADREPLRVSDVLDAVQHLAEAEFRGNHHVLKRNAVGPRLAVRADAKSLQQILMRLVSNASKYAGADGTVTLGAEREGNTVRIWVRDTGAGIPAEQLRNVFEPFFHAEPAMTRRVSGIGLGLTIARDLARRMDGEVTLASKEGGGTTASVILPAA